MGLDMYIQTIKKSEKPFLQRVKELNEGSYEEYKKSINEVTYWRKANQIHKWFVDNVQNGDDNCGEYELSKEVINQILEVCKKVKTIFDKATKTKGKVKNGQRWTANGWEDNLVEGDIYIGLDTDLITSLLPTEDGFFFGSTEIDEWYLSDIESSIKQLQRILDEVDFNEYHVYYTSSW